MSNPFQPPQAKITEHPEVSLEPRIYFLPWQILLVGCFGGPIALIYMVRSNEVHLGRLAQARFSLIAGIVLCVLALPLIRELNNGLATAGVYFGLTVLALLWVQVRQMPEIRATSNPALGVLRQEWPTLIFTILTSIGFSLLLSIVVMSAISMLAPVFL